jgi:hypothetical protein
VVCRAAGPGRRRTSLTTHFRRTEPRAFCQPSDWRHRHPAAAARRGARALGDRHSGHSVVCSTCSAVLHSAQLLVPTSYSCSAAQRAVRYSVCSSSCSLGRSHVSAHKPPAIIRSASRSVQSHFHARAPTNVVENEDGAGGNGSLLFIFEPAWSMVVGERAR